jgi:hypothetical protein
MINSFSVCLNSQGYKQWMRWEDDNVDKDMEGDSHNLFQSIFQNSYGHATEVYKKHQRGHQVTWLRLKWVPSKYNLQSAHWYQF